MSKHKLIKLLLSPIFLIFLLLIPTLSQAWVRGIYVTQSMLESTRNIKYLIVNARAAGIDTFVIDYWGMNRRTRQNIQLVKNAGLHYVARIVMFPYGALPSQVHSEDYLNRRYKQIMEAVSLGAERIQLDYIRYRTTQRKNSDNARDIFQIIKAVHDRLAEKGIPLEIDIFGEAAEMDSKAIGQNAVIFANAVGAICPMVYPSHYFPYPYHAVRPYETVYRSLSMLRERIKAFPDVKIVAYIELYNFRFPLSRESKIKYILEEMRAVRDAQADGWYAWSAMNKYRLLWYVMESRGGR